VPGQAASLALAQGAPPAGALAVAFGVARIKLLAARA
jgi:hypothetical protein